MKAIREQELGEDGEQEMVAKIIFAICTAIILAVLIIPPFFGE